jgi:hypothetical protein
MGLGVLKALSDQAEELGCASLLTCHRIKKAASRHFPGKGFNESLGGKAMNGTIFKTKHISRQVEGVDLAATICEQLIGPHCSRDNLIDILCGLSVAEDFPPFTILELSTKSPLAGQSDEVPINWMTARIVGRDQHGRNPPELDECYTIVARANWRDLRSRRPIKATSNPISASGKAGTAF